MNAQLTTAQTSVRNADEFRDQLNILDQAGVGVVLCRTREPHRAMEAIRSYAFSRNNLGFRNWSLTYGWETYNKADPSKEPDTDPQKNPAKALEMIAGLDGTDGFPPGFYTVMFPHFFLKENANSRVPMLYTLKEYCKLFSEQRRRLVLLAPVGYSLPPEVNEDVVILDFDVPSYAELTQSLEELIDALPKKPKLAQADKDKIVAAGMGMARSEFETAVSRSVVALRHQLPNIDVDELLAGVMESKTEVVKRSEVLEVMPTTNMNRVGGLENLKEWVAKRKACFTQEAKDFGIEAPKGVGLFGPPGTGKSLAAKAIGHTLGLPLIKFDVGRVFQSLVGQSEERVRAALKMLDSMAPAVVLLDEIDKAFQRSGGGDSGVSQRIMGSILTHMQESEAPIFWVFSANRVDNLPPELVRKGRLDEIFAVSTPDEEDRLAVLKIHLNLRKQNAEAIPDLARAVDASNGYVSAELEQAVKDTLVDAYTTGQPVTGELIAHQFDNIKPLSEAFKDDFDAMQAWAENNARPASKSIERRRAARNEAPAVPARRPPANGGGRKLNLDG